MFSSFVFKTFETLQFSKLACHAIMDNNKYVIKQAVGFSATKLQKTQVDDFASQN